VVFVTLAIVTVLFILTAGLVKSVENENWFSHQEGDTLQATHIAESGLNYYLWYLNHHPDDWQDGTEDVGPYIHDYTDADGTVIGRFILDITPPDAESGIGVIRSTGELLDDRVPPRAIEAQVGVPSLAKYAFLTNSDVWFGSTESVDGKLHSNGGIRFDGTCNDLITSAKETYVCGTQHGCADETKPGIWGTGGPDSFWSFPVAAIDFDQISGDLSELQTLATSGGIFIDTSNKYGYLVQLQSNGTDTAADDSMDVYTVTKTYQYTGWTEDGGDIKYRDDIKETSFLATYAMPSNGIVFIDDQIWVKGETSSQVTIAAAHFPESTNTNRSIVIADDITYRQHDGSMSVSLIAQEDVRVGYDSPQDLEIDAVMLAQRGKVIRPYYYGSIKNSITTYGGVISNKTWTWNWVNQWGTLIDGYRYTSSSYDPHLLYTPPPHFPTTGEFEILYWEEVIVED